MKMTNWTPKVLVTLISSLMCGSALADATITDAAGLAGAVKNALPGSTQPGFLSKFLQDQKNPQMTPRTLPPLKPAHEAAASLGPQADKIKFKLTQVILEDNHAYSDRQLSALFKDKINTEITIAELQNIVQNITNYYRNNGYILSRAILPPQHVHAGIVHIQVIEGYIDNVSVIGLPRGAHKIIRAYGEQLVKSRPLQIKVMEHYLRLANEIPGVQVKAVLEPSATNVGASKLNLSSDTQTVTGYLSYDNYGTRYIGPRQWTGNLAFNSIFLSGDSTRLIYATTTRPKELKFYDISYQFPLGRRGMNLAIGKNNSKTQPGLNLKLIGIHGNSTTYYATYQYPILRSRERNLTLDAGLNYLDSEVNSITNAFNVNLYTDHIRSAKVGGNYDFSDRFSGSNLFGLHIEQGFNVLGASNNPNSVTTSRFGATGVFTKFVAQGAHLQPLFGRVSAFVLVNGQYSCDPLLASEQYGFGGSQLGRGYDPAEIIGDRGAAGSLELRYDMAPGWFMLQTVQAYAYYDAGVIWNIKDVVSVQRKVSATSAGIGARFTVASHLSGNLMFTQPLTKPVSAEEVVGKGRLPRMFFSLIATL